MGSEDDTPKEIVFFKKVPKSGLRHVRKRITNFTRNDDTPILKSANEENSQPDSSATTNDESNNGTTATSNTDTSNQDNGKDKPGQPERDDKEEEDDDDNMGVDLKMLQELKELRELKRKQANGVSAEQLFGNDRVRSTAASSSSSSTPSVLAARNKIGLTTADALASDLDLGKTFSVETNRRDEDADMLKFIEEELAKRRGKETNQNDDEQLAKIGGNLIDLVFQVLPEHLMKNNEKKNEEMLSNQMLSGIPEVDLGVDERIRNIEATESAKQKVMRAGKSSRMTGNHQVTGSGDYHHYRHHQGTSTTVPSNLSANYVQHNKYNLGDSNVMRPAANKKPRIEPPVVKVVVEPVVVIGDQPKESSFKVKPAPGQHTLKFPGREKATDDYHYEKFKKSFRK